MTVAMQVVTVLAVKRFYLFPTLLSLSLSLCVSHIENRLRCVSCCSHIYTEGAAGSVTMTLAILD